MISDYCINLSCSVSSLFFSMQVLKLVDKDKHGNVHEEDLMGVAFVPLTEPGMDPFVGKDED